MDITPVSRSIWIVDSKASEAEIRNGVEAAKTVFAAYRLTPEQGRYTLRDLRKKGLTDEARIAGKATNKGGHKTEQMREYYVVGGLPQRARSNLAVLRSGR